MSDDDVVVMVLLVMGVVLGDEEGIDSEVQMQVFFLEHILAMWPCLEHSKQCPSCRCFCFLASVVAFCAVALVSMAFGSCGESWACSGHTICFLLECYYCYCDVRKN